VDYRLEIHKRSNLINKGKRASIFEKSEQMINQHALLRSSQFLNAFTIFLFQSDPLVQIKLFEDLDEILKFNTKNRQVFVNMGIQDFVLQILQKLCYQFKIPNNNLNHGYITGLVNFLKNTLSYGIFETSNQLNQILTAN